MEQLKVHLRKKAPNRFYSEAFKRKVVAEFEQGYYSKNQLQRNMVLAERAGCCNGAAYMVNSPTTRANKRVAR